MTTSAVFPGDTPFKRDLVLSFKDSNVINLTALTMSPHIGTHVDAPAHIKGDMSAEKELVGNLPLEPFIGPALVLDLAEKRSGITCGEFDEALSSVAGLLQDKNLPERILFKTQKKIRYEIFESQYSYFESDLIASAFERGVRLLGIDAPSADHIDSKKLEAHHELDKRQMSWLENLDLTSVSSGIYFLIALPIKFMELEASPVRAVLLET